MTTEEVIKEFNNHLKEIEGGISNLIYQLGDEYNDAKQDAMIRLIKHTEKYEIEEDKLKGLCFITLKNTCINVLKRKRHKYSHDSLDDKYDVGEEDEDNTLTEYHQKLKERILEHLTPSEYNLMVTYFNNIYEDEYDKALTAKIARLKARMGFSKHYILVEPDGAQTEYKYLNEIAKYIGCDYVYMTTAITNGMFNYKGDTYQIKTIGTILDKPKRKNKIK